jgi:hypothetical protein
LNRWLLILGRVGTVLIAIGLALLLVSLIPPTTSRSFGSGSRIAPDTFEPLGANSGPFANLNGTFFSQFFSTLTPQQELKVEIECNGSIQVFLLKISLMDLMNNFSGTERTVTLFEDFLQSNPDVIGWQGEILEEGVVDYIPTEVVNVTIVFSNPSSNTISIDYNGSILSLLAPAEKVRTLAIWAIPIGFVLAFPWFVGLRKQKSKFE